jgi:hypothetical protein
MSPFTESSIDRLATWATEGRSGAGPKAVFYFEAFDEP